MKNRIGVILLFVMVLFVLGGCQNSGNESVLNEGKNKKQSYLYESETVKVIETSGWQRQKNSDKNEGNIVFRNGNVKAVLATVSNEKSIDDVKSELKVSFGNSETIEETDQYISLKSNRKESMRADIYLSSGEKQTGILIFITPVKDYETNQGMIEEFKQNVHYF